MRTVLFLIRKEYLQVFRDRAMLFLIFFLPAVQLLLLSSAATFEMRNARMHVVDRDGSPVSRELVARMAASGRFEVAARSASLELANRDLLARRVSLVLHIPPDFEHTLVRERVAPVQLLVDAENGAAAGVMQSYAASILNAYAADLGVELHPEVGGVREGGAPPPPAPGRERIEVRTRGWFNPRLDYSDYMVPGILVLLVTLVGTLLSAMNIAREKELGTLEQLNVTPLTRSQFIAGKLLPFWILALVELTVGLSLARLVFDIPMRGSLLLVYAAAAVYLVAALGIGLWISTVTETQQQAIFVTYFILMIYMLMSGLFTPVESMPRWAQLFTLLNPVRHFIEIMRAVLVKGAGFAAIQTPFAILVAYAAAVLAIAVRQYRKTSA
ncbi:MAG TPA: ABC transporter permease [Longimicrobiaceae bacterium]|nr:ABC transporter permease [Longimicrobiaceae bacterium]